MIGADTLPHPITGHAAVYVGDGPDLTPEWAEEQARTLGISLAHDCDETDPAYCDCTEDGLDGEGLVRVEHAPGDTRCEAYDQHRACSHDLTALLAAVRSS